MYRNRPRPVGRLRRATFLVAAAAVLLSACSNNIQVHGNLPEPETVAEIQTGTYGREDVAQLLGSPSAVSTFEDDRWYYIGQKTSQIAFLRPDVLERRVLVVSFDGNGRVDSTRTFTLADGRTIDPVSRVTPTEGRELTILQQMFGNIGRFPNETVQNQRR